MPSADMTPPILIRTARLEARRYAEDEIALLERLYFDPRVMRYAGGVQTPEKAREIFATRIHKYYADNPGLGIWGVFERATGEPIGLHLLNNIQGETHLQVGYLLYPEYWGRGYATEMGRAVVRYGYAELGLPRIVAITDLDNVDSQRVLLKCGLTREGEKSFAHPAYADQGPLAWFVSDRETWLARNP
jgi:RimJ/RimL family protein N-acetyltransferase